MKITIITACRNTADTIADCVRSVVVQSHPDIEHWIVDGDSGDGTKEWLETNQARFGFQFLSEPDAGLYEAMNKGIARATGEVIGFLNADDWLASETVLSEVAETLSDPDTGACFGDLHYVSRSDPDQLVRRWIAGAFEPGAFSRGWMPPHPTFYAKRQLYDRLGGFDTRYRFGADWELLFRFLEVSKTRTAYVPHHWVTMRLGGKTNHSLGNILANHRECLSAFRDHGVRAGFRFTAGKIVHRLRQFRWRRRKK